MAIRCISAYLWICHHNDLEFQKLLWAISQLPSVTMNYENIHIVRDNAANIRAIYGHRYDMGEIDRNTFEKVLEITGEMKNNPQKFMEWLNKRLLSGVKPGMITMNFGARNNPSKNYDENEMMSDLSPEKLDNPSIQNMILRDSSDSINWIEQRGNSGDNVDKETIEEFHESVLNKDAKKAAKIGHTILETQMHPTAEEICKSPVKQFVYNVCGKRAYRYEIEE